MTTVLCECGCGAAAPIAQRTERSKGRIRGKPQRFVKGHSRRGAGGSVVGQTFGRLLVVEELHRRGRWHVRQVLCRCRCGRDVVVDVGNLRTGGTQSCGCLARKLAAERNRAKVPPPVEEDRGYETPCLIWQGGTGTLGYGQRREGPVHRLAYEEAYGPIPDGHQVHHRCRQRACVNPEHLETLTAAEHTRLHQAERVGG